MLLGDISEGKSTRAWVPEFHFTGCPQKAMHDHICLKPQQCLAETGGFHKLSRQPAYLKQQVPSSVRALSSVNKEKKKNKKGTHWTLSSGLHLYKHEQIAYTTCIQPNTDTQFSAWHRKVTESFRMCWLQTTPTTLLYWSSTWRYVFIYLSLQRYHSL